jgi:hypothetical protein
VMKLQHSQQQWCNLACNIILQSCWSTLMYLLSVIANKDAMYLGDSAREAVCTVALQLDGTVQANHLLYAVGQGNAQCNVCRMMMLVLVLCTLIA